MPQFETFFFTIHLCFRTKSVKTNVFKILRIFSHKICYTMFLINIKSILLRTQSQSLSRRFSVSPYPGYFVSSLGVIRQEIKKKRLTPLGFCDTVRSTAIYTKNVMHFLVSLTILVTNVS